jgi:hypothetical protein
MAKSFIELTNLTATHVTQCERQENGTAKAAVVDIPVQAMVDAGISAAIGRSLYLMMEKDPSDEKTLDVGPFRYGVALRKTGDSHTLNPTFSLTNEKALMAKFDKFEEKPYENLSLVEEIQEQITDEIFLNTVIHCCQLDEYDTIKGEWVQRPNENDRGVALDRYMAQMMVAIHVSTILHVLATSKDPEKPIKYEVQGEGTYTIERVKDKWQIGFVASKEFKQAIKNDRLVESMA